VILSVAVRRAIRLMVRERGLRGFWLGRAGELLADWVHVVGLLILTWRLTDDVSVVAALMLARLLPRLLLALRAVAVPGSAAWERALKAPLAASLVFVDASGDLWWAAPVVFAGGALSTLSDTAHVSAVRGLTPAVLLGTASTFNQVLARLCFVVGPLVCSALVSVWSVDAAFFVAAAGFLLSALAAVLDVRLRGVREMVAEQRLVPADRPPELLVIAAGLFLGAVVAMATQVTLVERLTLALGRSTAALGVFVAIVGAGMLLGPLHVPRLLGRFAVGLLLGGCVAGSAVALAAVGLVESEPLVVLALFGMGVLSITAHAVSTTATRRVVPHDRLDESLRFLATAVVAGQVAGAGAVALTARGWATDRVMLGAGVVSVALMAPAVLLQLTRLRGPARVVAAPK
jgi:hypothetical protein